MDANVAAERFKNRKFRDLEIDVSALYLIAAWHPRPGAARFGAPPKCAKATHAADFKMTLKSSG
jgi:hypothetical protein